MFFKDKNILIIGGTGTIGKSILSNILEEKPKVVRIFSRSEYNQFLLQEELRGEKSKYSLFNWGYSKLRSII